MFKTAIRACPDCSGTGKKKKLIIEGEKSRLETSESNCELCLGSGMVECIPSKGYNYSTKVKVNG